MLSTILIGDHNPVHVDPVSERLAEAGIHPSVGAAGSSCENALADTINGLYETELIRPGKPLRVGETLAFFAVSGGWPSDDAPPIAPAANANCDNMFEPVC